MYPCTSSSHSQKPMGPSGLIRYGSAPDSLLATAVDSVIGAADREFNSAALRSQYCFSGDSSSVTSESTCKVNSSPSSSIPPNKEQQHNKGLHRSYCLNEIAARVGSSSSTSSSSSSSLVRQRSSPAGLLSHLAAATTENNG